MSFRILLAASLVAWLSACGQKPAEEQLQPTRDAATPAVAEGDAAPAADSSASFSVDPASIAECGKPVVATLKWDVREKHPGVVTVQIHTGSDDAPVLFAEGGNYGEAKTEAWTGPGSIFVLRDKASGEELQRVIVAGPACG